MQISRGHTIESFKDQLLIFFSNSYAIINDTYYNFFIFITSINGNFRWFYTLFYRIIHEIGNHVCHMHLIRKHFILICLKISRELTPFILHT